VTFVNLRIQSGIVILTSQEKTQMRDPNLERTNAPRVRTSSRTWVDLSKRELSILNHNVGGYLQSFERGFQ